MEITFVENIAICPKCNVPLKDTFRGDGLDMQAIGKCSCGLVYVYPGGNSDGEIELHHDSKDDQTPPR